MNVFTQFQLYLTQVITVRHADVHEKGDFHK